MTHPTPMCALSIDRHALPPLGSNVAQTPTQLCSPVAAAGRSSCALRRTFAPPQFAGVAGVTRRRQTEEVEAGHKAEEAVAGMHGAMATLEGHPLWPGMGAGNG